MLGPTPSGDGVIDVVGGNSGLLGVIKWYLGAIWGNMKWCKLMSQVLDPVPK